MDSLQVPWLAEIGLVSWRTVKFGKRPPLPSEILATFIIFGAFSLIPDKRISSLLGWGIVVASALNVLPAIVAGPSTPLAGAIGIDPQLTPGAPQIPQSQIDALKSYNGEGNTSQRAHPA